MKQLWDESMGGMAVVQLALGVVLLTAGMAKARSMPAFRTMLIELGLRSPVLTSVMAVLMLAAELWVGIALSVGIGTTMAGPAATLMLLAIWVAVASAILSGQKVRCACFGAADSEPMTGHTLLRVSMLLGMSIALSIRRDYYEFAAFREVGFAAGAAAVASALMLVVCVAWLSFTAPIGRLRRGPLPTGGVHETVGTASKER